MRLFVTCQMDRPLCKATPSCVSACGKVRGSTIASWTQSTRIEAGRDTVKDLWQGTSCIPLRVTCRPRRTRGIGRIPEVMRSVADRRRGVVVSMASPLINWRGRLVGALMRARGTARQRHVGAHVGDTRVRGARLDGSVARICCFTKGRWRSGIEVQW